mmetsp:Transcript_15443/g.29717  ORF Transcript_15443/g.29717 Transcript_15443/m.29717 type:complete len:1112 (+) Transcript_15443:17-3352(+)
MFESCYLGKIGDVIAGCICHASCATCGYGDWPTDQQDCVTCPEGSKLFVAHMDGTGYCADSGFDYPIEMCEDANIPSCEVWFSFDKCIGLRTGQLPQTDFTPALGHFPVYIAKHACACKSEAPSDPRKPWIRSTTTFAEVCPEQYCSSYEECQQASRLRLEGGRFPWEGRLVLDIDVSSADVDSSFLATTSNLRNRHLLDEDDAEMYSVPTTVCSNDWGYQSAYVACRSMGYSGVLQFALGEQTEGSIYWDDVWFPREDTDTMSMEEVAEFHSTFFGSVQCKGNEPSLMQCPLVYGWYNPNKLSESTSDPLSQQHPMPTCTQGQVVNLQCWPGNDAYEQEACEHGLCCADGCVSLDTEHGNPINTWPLENTCLDDASNPESLCNDAVHVQGDLKCDSKCRTSACNMDNWDCCPAGFVVDRNSQGESVECCEPVSPAASQLRLKLNKFGAEMTTASAFRGLSFNRIIGGAIIHQERSSFTKNNNRFKELYEKVVSSMSNTESFGMNPYLYSMSKLYRSDLDPGTYYSGSEVKVLQTITGRNQTIYPAFKTYRMRGFSDGFPVVLSTGINAEKAQELLDYMLDGHFYDTQTDAVKVVYAIYNGQLDLFCIFRMVFQQTDGGSIRLSYSVIPIDVNLYTSRSDHVRLGFELVYLVMVLLGVFSEALDALKMWRETGKLINHFKFMWNLVDAASILASLGSICLWIASVWYALDEFHIKLVYDLYTFPSHKWGRLQYKEENLADLATAVYKLEMLGSFQSAYVACCGVNLFLFLLRILKLLDFQPNMGILTRSVSRAMNDLMHFCVLLVIVLGVYVAMGTVIFGPTVEAFSTLERALQTTFDMLLGDFADTEQALLSHDMDDGLLTIPAVLFFYSFMSIVFLVILNFLLAIVVDAFADEKREVSEHEQSMMSEVNSMFVRWFHAATSAEYREHQSLSAMKRRIQHLLQTQNRLQKDPSYIDDHDQWTPVKVLAMLDERYTVQLDEAVLTRILKSDPDAPMSPDDLAEVAVAAFGRNQHPSVLKEPVQPTETDPMFAMLIQMQDSIKAVTLQVARVAEDVQYLKKQHARTDMPPESTNISCVNDESGIVHRGQLNTNETDADIITSHNVLYTKTRQ